MRRVMDSLYALAGVLAALLLMLVAGFVVTQIASRIFQLVIPGVDDFAAYCLVGTAFLALGPTLVRNGHIRVTLVVQRFGPQLGRVVDLWCLAIGLLLTLFFLWACLDFVWDSYRLHEVNHGMVATPLWIPRLSMPLGLLILVVAFVDEIVRVSRGGRLEQAESV